MCRINELSALFKRLHLIIFFIILSFLMGCATTKPVSEEASQPVPTPVTRPLDETIEGNKFTVNKGDEVIGRLTYVRLEKGDTLPDIARHFSLGFNEIRAANPGYDVWVPEFGERILLPLSFILPDAPRKGIVINLAAMRLFQFKGDREPLTVLTFPIGIGTEERSSPTGQMVVARKVIRPTWHVPASIAKDYIKKGDPLPPVVPPGPKNPLGEYALYLSKPSYLIHGTNKPASIGLRATNGCIRLYPEDVKRLYESTPVKTPVYIVDQPYLLGQSNGIIYLQVYARPEALDTNEFDKIYRKLKNVEKKSGRTLDWIKVKKVLAEARGVPVPVFEINPESGTEITETNEVRHPGQLYGRPVVPELKTDAWSILAADMREETDALRQAAIINHQGPQIPARVLSKDNSHRVIAGPFKDIREANEVLKRLKIDLGIEGQLIEPVQNIFSRERR
jgi:L,D-transpeptidase ErfK/SrfK